MFGNSSNIWNSVTNYPYFALGSANSLLSVGAGLAPSASAAKPALGGALTLPGAVASGGGWKAPGAAVSASFGKAGTVGGLSVPQSWAPPAPAAISPQTAGIEGGGLGANAAPSSGPAALLRGIPPTGKSRRTAGYVTKYGIRYSVMTRPPAAG
jgi:hypothetical protein